MRRQVSPLVSCIDCDSSKNPLRVDEKGLLRMKAAISLVSSLSTYAPTNPKSLPCSRLPLYNTDPSGYCESHKSEGWKQYKLDNPVISAATVRSGTVSARVPEA